MHRKARGSTPRVELNDEAKTWKRKKRLSKEAAFEESRHDYLVPRILNRFTHRFKVLAISLYRVATGEEDEREKRKRCDEDRW